MAKREIKLPVRVEPMRGGGPNTIWGYLQDADGNDLLDEVAEIDVLEAIAELMNKGGGVAP